MSTKIFISFILITYALLLNPQAKHFKRQRHGRYAGLYKRARGYESIRAGPRLQIYVRKPSLSAPAAYFSAALFFHSASALLASPLNFGSSTFKAALFG